MHWLIFEQIAMDGYGVSGWIYYESSWHIKEMMKAQLVLSHVGKDDDFFNCPGWDYILQDFVNN